MTARPRGLAPRIADRAIGAAIAIVLAGRAEAARADPAAMPSAERAEPAPIPSAVHANPVPSAGALHADPAAMPRDGYLAKKDRELADKRARAAATPGVLAPVTRVGVKPRPLVNLFHRWSEECLAVALTGAPPAPELQYRLLRDHYTNESTTMASKLVPTLVAAAKHFHVGRIEIVSGYRHPKYNLILRKKGHQVARDSEHSHGNAVDFRLPGVTTDQLARWALSRRMGGVGIYQRSNFVHVDVGPVRRWSGE